MSRFKFDPKPYAFQDGAGVRNAGRSEEYRERHEKLFGPAKTSPRGYCKIIYRDGVRYELHSQEELDAFEESTGKIQMRKIEI